jgi:hypothetical protein
MPDTIEGKVRSRAREVICALVLLLADGAFAHDSWLNGDEVDPITRGICCGVNDTKIVDHLVRTKPNGSIWFVDQPDFEIALERVQPSPDGHWWRSMDIDGEGIVHIRCVFAPYAY